MYVCITCACVCEHASQVRLMQEAGMRFALRQVLVSRTQDMYTAVDRLVDVVLSGEWDRDEGEGKSEGGQGAAAVMDGHVPVCNRLRRYLLRQMEATLVLVPPEVHIPVPSVCVCVFGCVCVWVCGCVCVCLVGCVGTLVHVFRSGSCLCHMCACASSVV